MSKKTRKKSPHASSGKPTRSRSIGSAKTPASKMRPAAASKSDNKAGKRSHDASPKASHKATSKQLKPSSPRDSAPARSKTTSAKTAVGNPPAKKKPLTGKADAAAAGKPVLTEGARAPGFRLPRDGGDTVSLADYSGKKLVLFFYPRADTPGCTKEAIDFSRLAKAFADSRTAILGVSGDSPGMQEAFRDKHRLSVPLVSDEKHEMLEAYGAWGQKSMYGRTFQGILRTTVLIAADGLVAKIWRNVKVDGHADEVLATARGS